jgi:hypothetical protein
VYGSVLGRESACKGESRRHAVGDEGAEPQLSRLPADEFHVSGLSKEDGRLTCPHVPDGYVAAAPSTWCPM